MGLLNQPICRAAPHGEKSHRLSLPLHHLFSLFSPPTKHHTHATAPASRPAKSVKSDNQSSAYLIHQERSCQPSCRPAITQIRDSQDMKPRFALIDAIERGYRRREKIVGGSVRSVRIGSVDVGAFLCLEKGKRNANPPRPIQSSTVIDCNRQVKKKIKYINNKKKGMVWYAQPLV